MRWGPHSVWLMVVVGWIAAGTVQGQYETEVLDGVSWTTNRDATLLGSPAAQKGGELRVWIPTFVPTLREHGPDSNRIIIANLYELTHESLLTLHHETREWLPALASHWRVSGDNLTFWFKIDAKAHFSNGKKVTAEDVVATFGLIVNPDKADSGVEKLFVETYERPVAESPDVVRVKAKALGWRTMLYFAAGMRIYPAEEARVPGSVYLDEFNWKQPTGTGPYIIAHPAQDVRDQISITLTRREDYWGKGERSNTGLYNFDRLHFVVVRDRLMALEKLKAGELDYYPITNSRRWVEECDFPAVKKGWVQKRKVYNEQPQTYNGYVFNLREKPFDDKNVRLAVAYAMNRKRLFEKQFYNEYEYIDSYYPASVWANPKNRRVRYDPRLAARLLDQAGYTKRNQEGTRVHATTGHTLEFTLAFGRLAENRYHLLFAEDLHQVGIKVGLQHVDANALQSRVGERKFKLFFRTARAPAYPNPTTAWSSDLASKPGNNNISGFRNPQVDALTREYDRALDVARRIEIMQRIDGLVFREHPVALGWYAPFVRLVYWNRYGMPDTVLTRFTDPRIICATWYLDPGRQAKLEAAMKSGASLPVGETIIDPWGVRAPAESRRAEKARKAEKAGQ